MIPGHGRPLRPEEAHEIGTADLAYLERLAAAAADAKDRGLSSGDALVAVYGVEPPRTTTDDFDLCGPHDQRADCARREGELPMRFEDKAGIVTGGSSGIGKAIAQRLASEGASLASSRPRRTTHSWTQSSPSWRRREPA